MTQTTKSIDTKLEETLKTYKLTDVEYFIRGYPLKWNRPADVSEQDGFPVYTKTKLSKTYYCAGYYCLKFPKGWVLSYCPKLITVQKHAMKGPFKSCLEAKKLLATLKTSEI